jgi:hypothetical protein
VCIHSQLKTVSSSEVAAMIQGVLHHCTSMEVDRAYTDSHGQSEVAFAFTQVICDGHGVVRNVRDGFYTLGVPVGDPRQPQAPRLMHAWDELTRLLAAA